MEISKQDRIKLIHFLNFVCDYEASKPIEEMDEELIKSCVNILLELQDKHVNHSSEFIDNQVRKIFHPEETEAPAPETEKAPKKVVSKKKIWLVAACIAILVALFSIVSFSSERSVVDVLEDFFGTYEFIPFGKEVELGEETYGKNGEAIQYTTISGMINKEKVNILYPNLNNELLKVNRIYVFDKKGNKHITIEFIGTNISMNIVIDTPITEDLKSICTETIIIDNRKYYLCPMDDIRQIQAYFSHNNNLYTITCPDRDLLINMLKNMEEIRYEN